MRYPLELGLSLLLVTGCAFAQATAPAPSSSVRPTALSTSSAQDSWAASASSGVSLHSDDKSVPAKEHFKFKEHKQPAYVTDGPGNPVNRDQVLGTEKPTWKDGRPPLNCSIPPLSPACKP